MKSYEATLRLVEAVGHVNAIGGRSKTVLGGAEHERLVEDTNASELDFEFFNPSGEGTGLLVEVGDANGGTFEDGCLGRLLVGGRESRLETVITFPEFVTTALFRLDTLFADIFTTTFWLAVTADLGRKVIILIKVAEIIILFLWFAYGTSSGCARCRAGSARVAAVTVNKIATITLWRACHGWGTSTSSWGVVRR